MRRHFIATRVFVVIATVLSTASSSSSSTSSSLYSSSAPSRQASPSSPLLAQSPATWSSSSTVGLLNCLRGGSVKGAYVVSRSSETKTPVTVDCFSFSALHALLPSAHFHSRGNYAHFSRSCRYSTARTQKPLPNFSNCCLR
jgi:hypothetical protein